MTDLSSSAHQLLLDQRHEWPMLEKGYASLATVQTRPIEINGTEILLQFNPGRMISSTAKIDPKSIAQRRCFLCESNLPPEQRGLPYGDVTRSKTNRVSGVGFRVSGEIHSDPNPELRNPEPDDYLILCNPFPIFPEHFTIPHRQHRPQQIVESLPAMLDLARDLADRYVVFYNGPRCGASAPDHLHFQAGTKDFLPLIRQYDRLKPTFTTLSTTADLKIFASTNYPARFLAFESLNPAAIHRAFDTAYQALQRLTTSTEEPPLNLLTTHDSNTWRTLLFPRSKHRPACYFAEGENKILLSPATVEMAGVCALPLEKDFHRLTRDDLVRVYEEVTLDPSQFESLCQAVVS